MESTWLTWAVHRKSEVRTRPRCLCILTFFRVLPLRLIAKSEEKGRLVNSINTVLSTLTANFHSESHVDVASTDLCRWPSHSVGDGLTVVRALSSGQCRLQTGRSLWELPRSSASQLCRPGREEGQAQNPGAHQQVLQAKMSRSRG